MKTPNKLTLDMMFRDIKECDSALLDSIFFRDGLAIVMNCRNPFRIFLHSARAPFLLEDYRIGVIQSGRFRCIVNLQEYIVEAGNIVVIAPGSIVEPLELSDDFMITGIGVSAERFRMMHGDRLPAVFRSQRRNRIVSADEQDRDLLLRLFLSLWNMKGHAAVSEASVNSMITVITSTYNDIFLLHDAADHLQGEPHNAAYNMFQRFIVLVNEHCREHRQLDFYADCICVTKRHLGTVVQQVSGVTAKEWIDKAVITAAKVMLRHTDKTVMQISDALNFPAASFFCKYFRRLTGCSPQRWREGKG